MCELHQAQIVTDPQHRSSTPILNTDSEHRSSTLTVRFYPMLDVEFLLEIAKELMAISGTEPLAEGVNNAE